MDQRDMEGLFHVSNVYQAIGTLFFLIFFLSKKNKI